MTNGDVNKELLIGFIDESIDSLNTVDSLFVKLESNPSNMEIVNAIFRPIHSLKGTAAYFGLMKLKKLAHTLENLLDLIRKGSLQVDRSIIDILLPGVDSLRVILANVRNDNSEVSDEKLFQTIISTIEKPFTKTNLADNDIITRIEEIISHLSTQVSADGIESLGKLTQHLSSIPALADLKFARSADQNRSQNKTNLTRATDDLYNILNKTQTIQKNSEEMKQVSDLILKMSSETRDDSSSKIVTEMVDLFEIFSRADTGLDSLAISMIMEKLTALKTEPLVVIQSKESCGDNDSEMPNEKMDHKTKHDKTMRIPEQSLDDFLRCVGELLGVEEMLRNLSRQINSGVDTNALSSNLKDAVGHFEGISKELRTKIMEVRKVEARILLQKPPRIVRDISAQSGKKIQVECIGEDIHIDKSYIDLLDAPLTHMVRNAADHGIETPNIRIAAGKSETGKIIVKLQENADDLELTIQDDGAGLNYEGLQQKAINLGLITKTDQLSKNDIIDLIFQSGVSTAQTVTDISGRGVGMDIVKRAVSDAGGKIVITSTPGVGTIFTVSIPRNASTQIIDGYMVRSFSDDMYVFPLCSVIEAFNILPDQICGIAGKGKVLNRRGTVLPLHALDNLLGSKTNTFNTDSDSNKMGVLIEIRGNKTVIAVKEIDGIQKVVCKQVEGSLLDNELFDGAAISGAGRVSMIVNMERLLDL